MKVIEYPHPYLRAKCHVVKKVDQSIKDMIDDMIDTMHAEQGTGLAAPQVQMPFRIITVTHDNRDYAFINPVIQNVKGSKVVIGQEGCLSFTDLLLPIPRKDKIRFSAWTPGGDNVDEVVSGDMARVLQHEVDHLNGVLFIDKLGSRPDIQRRLRPYLDRATQLYFQNEPVIDTELIDDLVKAYC